MHADRHMLPTRRPNEGSDSLAIAFATFTASADELQRSYAHWSSEMAALRRHLEDKEQELAREREISRHLRALAEVAAVLAHEVRNPVASMEIFAGLLAQSEQIEGEERAWVLQLQAGFRQLTATVSNVLHFHSSAKLEVAPLQIAGFVRRAAEFIEPLARRANVEVTVVNHADGAVVLANEDSLMQVVLNLAMNSVRMMSGDGALLIHTVANADVVDISVRDSGPGIAAELREKIFDAGFTTRAGSAGLGLAVAKRIVVEHGGTIEAMPGQPGAMFLIRLPRWKEHGDA